MSPIVTPKYTSAIYSARIYALGNFSEGTVPTVRVPIKQPISTEPNVCSAFRDLATGMGKMICNDFHSPGTAVRNARTAKTPVASVEHHARDAGMVC